MHLLVDITAHGLGHLAQTAPVLNALRGHRPKLRLTVRSAIPRERLALRIAGDFDHVPEARDFGFVMHNAVDIDLAASTERYRAFHADWPQRVAAEADWLRDHKVDAVLSNVAYLPLAAAAQAGIPAVGLCSLNWADLFRHYFGNEPWAHDIHAQMLAAYNSAATFLRVTPGLSMADFTHLHDVGPIARLGHADGVELRERLGIASNQRCVLLAMGGMEFRLPMADWPQTPGITWLLPAVWGVQRKDVRTVEDAQIEFTDLLASVDAVITKPGYGTFAEAACNGIPMLFLERDDWPETAHLAAWATRHNRVMEVRREHLLAGDVIDALDALWRMPAPEAPRPAGAKEAAAWLAEHLC